MGSRISSKLIFASCVRYFCDAFPLLSRAALDKVVEMYGLKDAVEALVHVKTFLSDGVALHPPETAAEVVQRSSYEGGTLPYLS